MKEKLQHKYHGDTIIEVLLAIAIFSAISVSAIALMNSGVAKAQRSLEMTMARNEIDAQAEALRFIHNNFIAESEVASGSQQFSDLWNIVERHVIPSDQIDSSFDLNSIDSCDYAYSGGGKKEGPGGTKVDYLGEFALSDVSVNGFTPDAKKGPFIINPRFVQPKGIVSKMKKNVGLSEQPIDYSEVLNLMIINGPSNVNRTELSEGVFRPAPLYPRITYEYVNQGDISDIKGLGVDATAGTDDGVLSETDSGDADNTGNRAYFRKVRNAEGIWVVGVQGDISDVTSSPEYYDFYVKTCWNPTGSRTHATLTTTVRLYNPESI